MGVDLPCDQTHAGITDTERHNTIGSSFVERSCVGSLTDARHARSQSPDPPVCPRYRTFPRHRFGHGARQKMDAALVSAFFENSALVWIVASLLLFGGPLIIALHQYWSSFLKSCRSGARISSRIGSVILRCHSARWGH
jgi:hypothetical protein